MIMVYQYNLEQSTTNSDEKDNEEDLITLKMVDDYLTISNSYSSEEKFKSLIENLSKNQNSEEIVFKITEDSVVLKYKIVLVEKDLYSFKFNKSSNSFIVENIYPLRGYYVAPCSETEINGEKIYPLVLMRQYGTSLANINNFFFPKNKDFLNCCVNKFTHALKIKNLSDYYLILNEIDLSKKLNVKLGVNRKTQETVIIKIYNKNELKVDGVDMLFTEIDIITFFIRNLQLHNNKKFCHPNIVKLYDVFEDKESVYIVTEYLSGQTLNSFIRHNPHVLNETTNKKIIKQIAQGLEYLNKLGIVHRDLKLDNIMSANKTEKVYNLDNLNIKIIDFKLSKVLGREEVTQEGYGTLLYTRPEILCKNH